MSTKGLRKLAHQSLIDLATGHGINASGKDDVFGCIFGRDSALTVLKILRVHQTRPSLKLLEIARRALLTIVALQGQKFNIESGEEPGKFIHEFRRGEKEKERVLNFEKPWYIYPDDTIKNYDSIDSTPLTLIALYKYYEITGDNEFLIQILPAVEQALNWITKYGDSDKDLLLEYTLPKERKHGGLVVQSWTDSHESLLDQQGRFPKYPIAPVEAQGYAWLALKLWGKFYKENYPVFSKKLGKHADNLKHKFNQVFLIEDEGLTFAAQALDGNKKQIKTITANPLILLWASFGKGKNIECIIEDEYIPNFIKRGFKSDLFDPSAGIRTMSTNSKTYNPNQDSYHNGSFWPILNGLIHEGLELWGAKHEAEKLKNASLKPILHFETPIELYISKNGQYKMYKNKEGQESCKVQAWSAAAMLDLLTEQKKRYKLIRPAVTLWQKVLFKYNPWKSIVPTKT